MTHIIDDNVPFSQSSIWQLQQQFYAKKGIEAWQGQVPFYATSNAFIANSYARIMADFMADYNAQTGVSKFTILELGAGCGQFSYGCLQQLDKYIPDAIDWHYQMSDIDQGIIQFWEDHEGFKAFTEKRQLSFLQYVAGDPLALELSKDSGPLIVIANYFFDSLPADIYAVGNEEIRPVRVSISSDDKEVTNFENIVLTYTEGEQLKAEISPVLQRYKDEILDSKLLIPTASFEVLTQLNALSTKGLLVLATDKAYVHLDELDHLDYPEITGHTGCFSVMVNFDAIAQFARSHNGSAFLPSTRSGIKTAAFSFGFDLADYGRTQHTCQHYLDNFAPTDYLNLYRGMQKQLGRYNLEEAVSFMALSCWDPKVFMHLYKVIYEHLDGADMLTINYLTDHLDHVAQNFFWLPDSQDVLFQIAVIFHTLKRYESALTYYQQSLRYFPDVFGLYFNCGVCLYHLRRADEARTAFEKADQLDSSDPKVQEWLDRL